MNEPMTSELDGFESHLRRLTLPTQQEIADRTEETFYRAGWAAAEKHFAMQDTVQPATTQRITPASRTTTLWKDRALTFTSGLAVGLIVWIGTSSVLKSSPSEIARNPIGSPENQTRESTTSMNQTEPSATVVLDQVESDQRFGGPGKRGPEERGVQNSGSISSPPIAGMFDLDPAMRQALSQAASLHWRPASASRQFSQVPADETNTSPSAANVLRTSPLHRDDFTDLL